MLEVFSSLVQELAGERPAVMATIMRQDGSSPRSAGTKLLVRKDGSLTGSIGGGTIEARVIAKAKELMGQDSAVVMEIRLSGRDLAGTDMICGGNVDVLLQAFIPKKPQIMNVFDATLRLIERGGKGIVTTGPLPEPGEQGRVRSVFYQTAEAGTDSRLVAPDDTEDGWVDRALALAEETLAGKAVNVAALKSGRKVLIEPVSARPTVIIFGAGHVSVSLAPLLVKVGFDVTVVDDREEFASKNRFPQVARVLVNDFKDPLQGLYFNQETYVVIVTRGHSHDKTILQRVLATAGSHIRYIGMIGSLQKRDMIFESLMQQGISLETITGRVRCPIGLGIGAETPEEIAISIAAELIKVRAEGFQSLAPLTPSHPKEK